jgi:hypothetical protein
MQVDVLLVGDFRFPGGTSTSTASEARALAAAGYRLGLLSLATAPLSPARPIHPEIQALADAGLARFVPPHQPVTANLTLLHHPAAFQTLPAVPPLVTSHRTLLVVHHPATDAEGTPQYDVDLVIALTEALYGPVTWAPVGPSVRKTLDRLAAPPPMLATDWVNILDPADWTAPPTPLPLPRHRPVIGRHSRPAPEKWPADRETFLAAYPDSPEITVRLMGYSPALDQIVGPRPANWQVLPFAALPVRDFLHSIDYFVYFHAPVWIEAFGRSILEAMAAGKVCLLPATFEPLFGEAAVYCAPHEVLAHVRRLEADPVARATLADRARDMVADRFGPQVAVTRVAALIGGPAFEPALAEPVLPDPDQPDPAPPAQALQRPRILYFTSNGVGMGHLARCMASARRLPPGVDPVIVTMSKAFGVVRDEGLTVEHLGYFRALDLPHGVWTGKLAAELGAILDYYAPEVFVFDGNVPYDALMTLFPQRPEMWKVWQRRPLWRPDTGQDSLARSEAFDLILEPGELAAPVDRGLTAQRRDRCLKVPPIRFLDEAEALTRSAARTLLGLDPTRPAVLLQLGAGNNFDFRAAAEMVFNLAAPDGPRPDLQVVFARWRIAEGDLALPPHVQCLDTFPIARHLAAFDMAVASAGYNTFHENLAAGLPTLFLGNDHPEQDEQGLRAGYAALRGMALAARADDRHGIRRGLESLLQPQTRVRLTAACNRARQPNGALPTARVLSGLALTRKASALTFRPPGTEADR